METPASKPVGRNEPCHCGSGRKYKQCCLAKDETAAREARAKAQAADAAAAADAPVEAESKPHGKQHGHPAHGKDTRIGGANTRGFQKTSGAPRKVGGG